MRESLRVGGEGWQDVVECRLWTIKLFSSVRWLRIRNESLEVKNLHIWLSLGIEFRWGKD